MTIPINKVLKIDDENIVYSSEIPELNGGLLQGKK